MNTLDDFITLLQDEFGLPVTIEDASRHLDEVSAWDSMHMLALLSALEQRTGQRISLPDALEASSLEDIYALAASA
ncbi:acyl carrier protein [Streptomyces armeniacus]|uniref:Acyl carrier protein n=1 Tax=Streptomyces armeniacus TaxID=83291 RepID=A0A345XLB0_9ACTN|nr:acyl carrier protein [Streptomyces armeniacus]AXK32426.1 acyl carrier protein [Streptomyces armeniacus]